MLNSLDSMIQILDAIDDLVLVKGAGSRLLWANKAFRTYYGMSNEQLQNIIDAPTVPPDFTAQYIKDDAYVFETGSVLNIPEEPIHRFDGEVRWFNTVKSPIFDEVGKVDMIVGVSRDITVKREQERLIAEQQAKMMANSKMSSLGEMASEIAHEINNPLAIIQSYAIRIQMLSGKGLLNRQDLFELTEKISQTCVRAGKIVRGLKVVSREGSLDPFQTESLGTIFQDTFEISKERFKHAGIRLDVAKSMDSISLECRPTQISQLLLNLLNNAFDAVVDQGPEGKWVSIDAKSLGGQVEIQVSDGGQGVSESVVTHMFQPFFTTKASGKGTGLGLSICRQIVDAHHGTIELVSRRNPTIFRIILPLSQARAAG